MTEKAQGSFKNDEDELEGKESERKLSRDEEVEDEKGRDKEGHAEDSEGMSKESTDLAKPEEGEDGQPEKEYPSATERFLAKKLAPELLTP